MFRYSNQYRILYSSVGDSSLFSRFFNLGRPQRVRQGVGFRGDGSLFFSRFSLFGIRWKLSHLLLCLFKSFGESLTLFGATKLDAHVIKFRAFITVRAINSGEDARLFARRVLRDFRLLLHVKVGANLERLVATHQDANLLRLLVFQELQRSQTALFPLAIGEAVRLDLTTRVDKENINSQSFRSFARACSRGIASSPVHPLPFLAHPIRVHHRHYKTQKTLNVRFKQNVLILLASLLRLGPFDDFEFHHGFELGFALRLDVLLVVVLRRRPVVTAITAFRRRFRRRKLARIEPTGRRRAESTGGAEPEPTKDGRRRFRLRARPFISQSVSLSILSLSLSHAVTKDDSPLLPSFPPRRSSRRRRRRRFVSSSSSVRSEINPSAAGSFET